MYKEYETLELTLHTAISFPTPLVSAEPLLIDRCRSMIASVVQRLAKVHSPGPFTTRGGVQDQSSHVASNFGPKIGFTWIFANWESLLVLSHFTTALSTGSGGSFDTALSSPCPVFGQVRALGSVF